MRRSTVWLALLAGCGINPAFDMTTTGLATDGETTAQSASTTGLPPGSTGAPTTTDTTASLSTATEAAATSEPASTSTSSTTTAADTTTSDETTAGTTTGDPPKEGACPELDSLVACYTFPADAGDDLVDSSPNMLDGVKLFTNPSDTLPGYGVGVEFVDQSDVAVKPNEKFITQYFTIATFAFVKNGSFSKALIDKQDHYGLFIDNGEARCVVRSTAGMKTVKRTIPVETWIHLSCTFDGAKVSLRVYGPEAPTEPGLADLGGVLDPDTNTELRLGWDPPLPTTKFNGKLDHVLVFSEALVEQQLCLLAGPLCP